MCRVINKSLEIYKARAISQSHQNGNIKNAPAVTTEGEDVEPLYERLC